jgi:hypothetical protein
MLYSFFMSIIIALSYSGNTLAYNDMTVITTVKHFGSAAEQVRKFFSVKFVMSVSMQGTYPSRSSQKCSARAGNTKGGSKYHYR